jgi:hypothetical protein
MKLLIILMLLVNTCIAQSESIVIEFPYNSSVCDYKQLQEIKESLDYLNNNQYTVKPKIDSIVGYASIDGNKEDNLKLSKIRAVKVKRKLQTKCPIYYKGETNLFGKLRTNRIVIIYISEN